MGRSHFRREWSYSLETLDSSLCLFALDSKSCWILMLQILMTSFTSLYLYIRNQSISTVMIFPFFKTKCKIAILLLYVYIKLNLYSIPFLPWGSAACDSLISPWFLLDFSFSNFCLTMCTLPLWLFYPSLWVAEKLLLGPGNEAWHSQT